MRKGFNFYNSYWEQMKLLNDKQKLQIFNAICEVQFLENNINDIVFEDKIVTLVWTGMKHSIETSLNGYLSKQKALNKDINAPLAKGLSMEGVQQVKEQVKEKEQYKKEFTFNLDKQKLLSSTSKEYQDNLKEYILKRNDGMTFEYFYNECEMKPYKYKNYKLAYDKWNRGTTSNTSSLKQNPALGGYN